MAHPSTKTPAALNIGALLSRTLALACVVCAASLGAAATHARGVPLTGFLSEPTDQIAVPGMLAGAEITPEGDLYTGWAEYELRYGRGLTAWDQPTRTLPNPGRPLLSSTLSDGPVLYIQTVFAVAVAGLPVAYDTVTVLNGSNRPRRAQVAMALAYTRGREILGVHGEMTGAFRYERPFTGQPAGFYEQPGQSFSPAFRYSTVGRDIDRSGLLLARGPAGVSRQLPTPAANEPTTPHACRLFRVLLRAHGRHSFTWQIPLNPPAASPAADRSLDALPLNGARAVLNRVWSTQEAGMMRISVPERKVNDTYRAAISEMLSSRYLTPLGWVQGSNKLQYQAFWIRDGALETQALDLAGLHHQASQNLAFIDTFQQPDGLFINRAYQYDSLGQALWALDQHAQLTRSPAYAAAQLGRIQAAVNWLTAVTATDPLGLLPPGNPQDNELAYGHITGDDLWAAAGLRSAIADATLSGREDLAAAWRSVDQRFERSLDTAISAAVASTGHIPPVLDAAGGQDWGNYDAAFPLEVLPAASPAVKATMAWGRAHMAQGLATYENGHSLHDYLGFSVFETELAAGEASRTVAGLYSELVHTTSTDNGWEWDIPPLGKRASNVNLSPHGTFAADYVALLRNMLVRETEAGGLNLLSGASPAWLSPGAHITVADAPTEHGVISFTERSSSHGETLTWRCACAPGTATSWILPAWARDAHVMGKALSGGRVALHGASGTVSVTFGGHRPAQSYARAVGALNSIYRAHSRPAPLRPATE